MLGLTNSKKPLCYNLQNSHLITCLPFIDSTYENEIPKSKVLYLIRAEQQRMKGDPKSYIAQMPVHSTPYVDSLEFKANVDKILLKIQEKKNNAEANEDNKDKQMKDNRVPELPKKIVSGEEERIKELIYKGLKEYQYAVWSEANNEIFQKVGPSVLKDMISNLQKEKVNLQQAIEKQTKAIQQINRMRRYQQMEAYQRQSNIENRIKLMIYKRRKTD